MPIDSDRILLERIRGDDPGAFDEFVERYGHRIFAFGMRVCGERENAREVAQETLLQAFLSLKTLQEPKALRSWLYRVVSNACLMSRRKRRGQPRRELSLDDLLPDSPESARIEIPDVAALPDGALERKELQAVVREAIAGLPVHYRLVILLRDIEQLSTQETAEALELPESTIKMRLHRARLMVRQALEGRLRGGPAAEPPS